MTDAGISIGLLTTSRDDLADIARCLARALDPDFMKIPDSPVVVTINGSYNSGKKVLPDIMREVLIAGREMTVSGKKGYDEYHQSPDGKLQFTYADLGYDERYSDASLNARAGDTVQDKLLQKRTAGGVTFLQNAKAHLPGLHLWVENGRDYTVTDPLDVQECASPLRDAFQKLSKRHQPYASLWSMVKLLASGPVEDKAKWLRYVQIDITDHRLQQSPALQQACNDLTLASADVKKALIDKKAPIAKAPKRPYAALSSGVRV